MIPFRLFEIWRLSKRERQADNGWEYLFFFCRVDGRETMRTIVQYGATRCATIRVSLKLWVSRGLLLLPSTDPWEDWLWQKDKYHVAACGHQKGIMIRHVEHVLYLASIVTATYPIGPMGLVYLATFGCFMLFLMVKYHKCR